MNKTTLEIGYTAAMLVFAASCIGGKSDGNRRRGQG